MIRVIKQVGREANPSVNAWKALARERGWKMVEKSNHWEVHLG